MHCILYPKIFPNNWKTELRGSQEVEITKLETLKTIETPNIVTMTQCLDTVNLITLS